MMRVTSVMPETGFVPMRPIARAATRVNRNEMTSAMATPTSPTVVPARPVLKKAKRHTATAATPRRTVAHVQVAVGPRDGAVRPRATPRCP